MIVYLRPQWYVAIVLLAYLSSVQGNNKESIHYLKERLKRNTFRNGFTDKNQDEYVNLQTSNQDLFPYSGPSESPYRLGFVSKSSGDNYNTLSNLISELESQNLKRDTIEAPSNFEYLFNSVKKRDPEIDTDDRSDLDDLKNFDNEDDVDVVRRRVPQFAHSFIGKRRHQNTDNGSLLKRMPAQLFVRRAPHYSHSFVGKRSVREQDLNSKDIHSAFSDKTFDYPDIFQGKEPTFAFPSHGRFQENGNFRSDPNSQYPESSPVHNVVKRSTDDDKRGPAFGHSFVGKRGPRFGHSFVGKRGPRFGHSFVGKRLSFGHSFVGKREDDSAEDFETNVINDDDEADISRVLSLEEYPEQIDFDSDHDSSEKSVEIADKRQQRHSYNPSNYLGKRPSFSHSFVGKRGLRFGHSFVGKRPSFGHSFVGKRGPSFGHSFVGKRGPRFGHSFVGKRGPAFGHSFVGKRPSFGHSFVGKRGPSFGHNFVGKRPGFSHSFVGKRDESFDNSLSEKQGASNADFMAIENDAVEEFSRNAVPIELLASQKNSSDSTSLKDIFEQGNSETDLNTSPDATGSEDDKRVPAFGHSFVGKRAPGFGHTFVGKRAPGFGHNFVGKRAPGFGHNFVGKRTPGFGHSFVGKRAPVFGHNFVGKRVPGFGHSFVGKRVPGFGHSFVGKRVPGFGHSFVGKRENDLYDIDNISSEEVLAAENMEDLVNPVSEEQYKQYQEGNSISDINSNNIGVFYSDD